MVDTIPGERDPAIEDKGILSSSTDEVNRATVERKSEDNVESGTDSASGDDENTVWWDSDDDPENPLNWPSWRKISNCVLVSSLAFLTPLASSMFAPGVPELMVEFNSTSTTLGAFCVSVYVLGFAAGPMVFAPLSELYGRVIVYHACNLGFIVFVIACAEAPSLNALIAFRFFSGLFGGCPMTNGGGSIADMIVQEKRGTAIAAFSIGPLLGPVVGPVVGGLITDAKGWRWTFWVLAILGGFVTICCMIFSQESYAPVILKRKAQRLRKETGNELLHSKLDPGLSPVDYFKRGIVRPFKMLMFSPICIISGIYVGLAYSYLYLLFTSLTPLFMRIYHFNVVHSGLTFLGLGIGSMIGVGFFSRVSDRYIRKMTAQEMIAAAAEGRPAGETKPEWRLPPLKIGAVVMPVGFFIYGWTAEYETHWIAPIIGTGIIGVGNIIIFIALQMYLVDSFTLYSASALASNAVVRSFAGALLPLAGIPMYDAMGMGWGNSMLGFVALAMVPAPWLFLRYGEYLRRRFEIKDI